MTKKSTLPFALAAAALACCCAWPATGASFSDTLEVPAHISPIASKSLMLAVAKCGGRLVAVGQRGHIVVSTDGGESWKQSRVPVSSDLTAVYFVDARQGWAVGHDGVILHTEDAGDSWQLQLDGRKANELLVAGMEAHAAQSPASERAKKLLAEAVRYREQGPDKPFLDVWFSDANNGYAVGAYNLIFRTVDGGKHWSSLFERTENPKLFNLYAIRPIADALYIAGEGGLVMKLDPAAQTFKALSVPYNGSFFGLAPAENAVVVFGLRGNVFRSDDGGQNWSKVDAGLTASVVASTSASGRVLLADAGGRVAASADGGRSFKRLTLNPALPLTGLVPAGEGRFATVGPRGVTMAHAKPD